MKKGRVLTCFCLLVFSVLIFGAVSIANKNSKGNEAYAAKSEYIEINNTSTLTGGILAQYNDLMARAVDVPLNWAAIPYNEFNEIVMLLGSDDPGWPIGILGFLFRHAGLFQGTAEWNAMSDQATRLDAILTEMTLRERQIAAEVVNFYRTVVGTRMVQPTEPQPNPVQTQLLALKARIDGTEFRGNELKMSYILFSSITVDIGTDVSRNVLPRVAFNHAERHVTVGLTYIETVRDFTTRVGELSPVKQTKKGDLPMLRALRAEVWAFRSLASPVWNDLGITGFQSTFNNLLWELDIRINEVSGIEGWVIFVIVLGVFLVVGLGYMLHIGAISFKDFGRRRRRKEAKEKDDIEQEPVDESEWLEDEEEEEDDTPPIPPMTFRL